MKKKIKYALYLLLLVGITGLCGSMSSCASSEDAPMYRSQTYSSKYINSNYRVKGSNRHNGATYRSY